MPLIEVVCPIALAQTRAEVQQVLYLISKGTAGCRPATLKTGDACAVMRENIRCGSRLVFSIFPETFSRVNSSGKWDFQDPPAEVFAVCPGNLSIILGHFERELAKKKAAVDPRHSIFLPCLDSCLWVNISHAIALVGAAA